MATEDQPPADGGCADELVDRNYGLTTNSNAAVRNFPEPNGFRIAAKKETLVVMDSENGHLDDIHTREMYALYGLAMYFAQVMEAAVRLAIVMAKMSNSPSANREEFDDLLSSSSNTVLGKLIESLKPFLANDATLESDLGVALRRRNYLAHHFFWDHAVDAMSTEGRSLMMTEAVAAKELFESVEVRLDRVTRQYVVARGMSITQFESVVEREFHTLYQQAVGKPGDDLEHETKL